ncbi:hypothetical protein [Tritonibacter sp. SIMBA_163]|uniref:hypothetical protein n=1 Tax=Tritonibacter sp. SIMBA_163 TaxID=3080868 RepID=UPI00397FFE11
MQRYLCCKRERSPESGPSNGSDDHGDAALSSDVSKAQLATFAKSPELAAARNAYAARALGKAALLSVSHRFALNLKGVLAYRKIGLGASVAKAHI